MRVTVGIPRCEWAKPVTGVTVYATTGYDWGHLSAVKSGMVEVDAGSVFLLMGEKERRHDIFGSGLVSILVAAANGVLYPAATLPRKNPNWAPGLAPFATSLLASPPQLRAVWAIRRLLSASEDSLRQVPASLLEFETVDLLRAELTETIADLLAEHEVRTNNTGQTPPIGPGSTAAARQAFFAGDVHPESVGVDEQIVRREFAAWVIEMASLSKLPAGTVRQFVANTLGVSATVTAPSPAATQALPQRRIRVQ